MEIYKPVKKNPVGIDRKWAGGDSGNILFLDLDAGDMGMFLC